MPGCCGPATHSTQESMTGIPTGRGTVSVGVEGRHRHTAKGVVAEPGP